MKIPVSFQTAYSTVESELDLLKQYVEPRLQTIAKNVGGTYSGRIKTIESVLIKIEKELTENVNYEFPLKRINDLFGCRLIVPNTRLISETEDAISDQFEIIERRVRVLKPEEFAYNDINLTCKIKQTDALLNRSSFTSYLFEIQIKTLLQEAWGIAGHGILYKAKKKAWGIARITSQLRALLEMADSVLANFEQVAEAFHSDQEYQSYQVPNKIVSLLEANWSSENLPANTYRLAQTIQKYFIAIGDGNVETLETLLANEKYKGYIQARSLFPTQAIFIILFEEHGIAFVNNMTKKGKRVLIGEEMEDVCPLLKQIPADKRVRFEAPNFTLTS